MTLSLTLACAWIVIACVAAMFPSKRHHWPLAYVLIAVGDAAFGFRHLPERPLDRPCGPSRRGLDPPLASPLSLALAPRPGLLPRGLTGWTASGIAATVGGMVERVGI